jgi:hypothetical protein
MQNNYGSWGKLMAQLEVFGTTIPEARRSEFTRWRCRLLLDEDVEASDREVALRWGFPLAAWDEGVRLMLRLKEHERLAEQREAQELLDELLGRK